MKEARIRSNGHKKWMRFVIADDDKFWTGSEWSLNSRDALLFHKPLEARDEMSKAQQTLPDDDEHEFE